MRMSTVGRRWSALLALGATVSVLNGCAWLQVASIERNKHPASDQSSAGMTVVLTSSSELGKGVLTEEQTQLRNYAIKHCTPPSTEIATVSRNERQAFVLTVAALAFIEMGVSVVASEASNAMQAYADKEKAKFAPSPQTASIPIDYLWAPRGAPAFDCVIAGTRRADYQAKAANGTPGGDPEQWDLVFVAVLNQSPADVKPVAYRFTPTYFSLARSTALTTLNSNTGATGSSSPPTGQITTTLKIGIATPTNNGKGAVDAKIVLPKVDLPTCTASACAGAKTLDLSTRDGARKLLASQTPWFQLPEPTDTDENKRQLCRNDAKCIPAYVTVSLAQAGNGSPDFDRAKSELESGTKELVSTLDKILESKSAK
ncbi:hypothetical protein ACI2TO_22050 [Ralstonia nicotianae]